MKMIQWPSEMFGKVALFSIMKNDPHRYFLHLQLIETN